MEFKPIRHRFVAVLASFALVATASVTTAHTASAEELDTTDWSTLSETSSDSSTAEFVSEVILADTETFAIEPGVESESGVTVPESLDEPITIDGLTLDVPSAPGAEPMLTEVGDVIVPSENEGADLIIQEVDTTSLNFEAAATRTLITIDSQDVDPLFEFALDVPEGGSVDVDAETGSVVAYDADGNVSSLIAPPWAYDAEGNEVPTWFEVEDGAVYQYVDHLSRQFTYPVVADPVWLVPVLLFSGRLIIKEVISATLTAATAAAIKNVGTAAKYRSWTDRNKRHNLIIWSKRDPGTAVTLTTHFLRSLPRTLRIEASKGTTRSTTPSTLCGGSLATTVAKRRPLTPLGRPGYGTIRRHPKQACSTSGRPF